MEVKKIISGLLIIGTLSLNTCYAAVQTVTYTTQSGVYSPQAVAIAPTNYYSENYNYYPQKIVETVQVTRKETFAERHPVLTTLGVGALLAGAVTTGVLLSDNAHHRGHYYRHHHCR